MASVIELISKTLSLANQPPLAQEEIFERACAWQDVLEKSIPLERLPEAFGKAFELHESPFPITAFEINYAYKQILKEEKAKCEEKIRQEKENNPRQFCKNLQRHINQNGEVKQFNPLNPTGEDIILPCPYCRPKAYYEQKNNFISRYQKVNVLKIIPFARKA